VSVDLGTQHVIRRRHTVICGAQLYNIFPNYLTKGTIFEKELLNIKYVF